MVMNKILENRVRRIFRKAIKEGAVQEMHRTATGVMVPFGCDECVGDIEHRIDDAKYERDSCPGRTDAREHYNGILKVLRRKLRRANKFNLEESGSL